MIEYDATKSQKSRMAPPSHCSSASAVKQTPASAVRQSMPERRAVVAAASPAEQHAAVSPVEHHATEPTGPTDVAGDSGSKATFGFYFPVYNQIPSVLHLLHELRRFYPESPIHLLSDGGSVNFGAIC